MTPRRHTLKVLNIEADQRLVKIVHLLWARKMGNTPVCKASRTLHSVPGICMIQLVPVTKQEISLSFSSMLPRCRSLYLRALELYISDI